METLEVISNKKRQWAKRVQWLRNVHDTTKNNYRQQQPTRLGPLFQTPSVNGPGHSPSSTLALVTTHHNFLSYAHCFNWPVLLLTPLSPTYRQQRRPPLTRAPPGSPAEHASSGSNRYLPPPCHLSKQGSQRDARGGDRKLNYHDD